MTRIDLDDCKYTVINHDGALSFERYGEPWPVANADLAHSGLVLALVQEIERLRERLDANPTASDIAYLKEAIRYGQFSDDMLRQHGLAQPILAALFRIAKE